MKLYIISARMDQCLEDVSLAKPTIQTLADIYKRQASTLPDTLKSLMPTLYGTDFQEGTFFWGLGNFRDFQGLHKLRCHGNKTRQKTITESALHRLHHYFPFVPSQSHLKCLIVAAEPVCLHPYFRPVIRSPGSIMTENPRALSPEYWEQAYPYVFAFHQGIELVQHQRTHQILAELDHEQWEDLLQKIQDTYGPCKLNQMAVESVMDCVTQVCH